MSTTTQPPASPPEGPAATTITVVPRVTGEQTIAAYTAVNHFPQTPCGFNVVGDRCDGVSALYMAANAPYYSTPTGKWWHEPNGGRIPILALSWFNRVYGGPYTSGFMLGWQYGSAKQDEHTMWEEDTSPRIERETDGYWDGRAARLAAREHFEM